MINLGLSRITRLLALSDTKRTWKAIHIAGTNGKGSVAAYTASILLKIGSVKPHSTPWQGVTVRPTVGRFTSPHLIDRWDCIAIDNVSVSQTVFEAAEKRVKARALVVEGELAGKAASEEDVANSKVTEFELLTATAFEIFDQARCQVAVIECGLGGRLDATNALKPEEVAASVITRIGLDHQGLLGSTIEEIAREKAGISKKDVPIVVDGMNQPSVKNAIKELAISSEVKGFQESDPETAFARWGCEEAAARLFPIRAYNLALALEAIYSAQTANRLDAVLVSRPDNPLSPWGNPGVFVRDVLDDVSETYKGRLQWLDPSRPDVYETEGFNLKILIDGAHNHQSATVLREYINSLESDRSSRRVIWILAMTKGKDVGSVLHALVQPGDEVIACSYSPVDGMPWIYPLSQDDFAVKLRDLGLSFSLCNNVQDALKEALRSYNHTASRTDNVTKCAQVDNPLIVVAGSLYLVSDLMRIMRDGSKSFEEYFRRKIEEREKTDQK